MEAGGAWKAAVSWALHRCVGTRAAPVVGRVGVEEVKTWRLLLVCYYFVHQILNKSPVCRVDTGDIIVSK